MEERFYAGLELEKDLKMCAVFDELQNNNDVIILDHGRNVLVNEMKYVNNYSLDREKTGKTHVGFDFHFITFYYKGRVWTVEPSTYYPFTDDNNPGLINAIPYELIDGWRKKQIGYSQKFESVKDCDNISYHITQKDYKEVYAHNIPFSEDKTNFENILKKSAGFRERSIYEAPHICYFITKTKDRKVIRCSKLNREDDGVRLSFDVDIVNQTITN